MLQGLNIFDEYPVLYQDAHIQLIPIKNKWEEETTLKIYMTLHPANSVEIGTVTNYELFQ